MSNTELALYVLLFAPLASAVISLGGRFFSSKKAEAAAFVLWLGGSAGGLSVLASPILSGETIIVALGGWNAPFGIELEIRGLAWVATLTDVVIATAAWLQTRRSDRFDSYFYVFFFMALFSLQGTLYTKDLFNLFIWFEVLSLASFALIAYDGQLSARLAALRYLLMSSLSVVAFLLGVWVLYYYTGTLSMDLFAGALEELSETGSRQAVGLALALVTGGILTRAAIIPFHTWLPEAHAAAPYPVSALLSGFVIKAPTLALWRILDYISFPALYSLLIWIGAASALIGVVAAMSQKDAKKLLGYHSISQMGYIVAAFGMGGGAGKAAALFFIIGHALFKSLLFLTVGEVTERAGSRDVYSLRGLGRRYPLQTALYAVAALSITGIPLFAGYTAKLTVSKALGSHPASWLLFAAGIGTVASFLKLSRIFIGRKAAPERQPGSENGISASQGNRGSRGLAAFGALVLALGCLLLGIIPARSLALFQLFVETGGEGLSLTASNLQWYTPIPLVKAGITILGGILLSGFLLSPPGKQTAGSLRRSRLGINGSLRLLTAGFAALIWYGALVF